MNEEPIMRIETTTTTTGVNYESAIMSALIARTWRADPASSRTRTWSGGRCPAAASPGQS